MVWFPSPGIVKTYGSVCHATRASLVLGSLDEFALVERGPGSYEGHAVGGVDGAQAVLS